MKKIRLTVMLLLVILGTTPRVACQTWAFYTTVGTYTLNAINLTNGSISNIKTDIKVVQFKVVDTVLYLSGFGTNTSGLQRWSTSLPYVLKHLRIDSLQDENGSAIVFNSHTSDLIWKDTVSAYTITYYQNNKLHSMSFSRDPLFLKNKYRALNPNFVSVHNISNIYKNICVFNVFMSLAGDGNQKHPEISYAYLYICDLKKRKLLNLFPIRLESLNNLTIIK